MYLNVSVDYEIDTSLPSEVLLDDAADMMDVFEAAIALARDTLTYQMVEDVIRVQESENRLVDFCRTGR